MMASKSNVADLATVTITPGNPLQDPQVITNSDFSSIYSVPLNPDTPCVIKFEFPIPLNKLEYISFGQTNIATKENLKITINVSNRDIVFVDDAMNKKENSTIFYDFGINSTMKYIEIEVEGSGQLIISDIAFGERINISTRRVINLPLWPTLPINLMSIMTFDKFVWRG